LRSVDEAGSGIGWFEFTVFRGLLRRVPRRTWPSRHPDPPLPRPQGELEAWLAGRRVDQRGPVLFWFTPTPYGGFRQDRRLSDEDVALFERLPPWFRKEHTATQRN
jgi:hypothetical protein